MDKAIGKLRYRIDKAIECDKHRLVKNLQRKLKNTLSHQAKAYEISVRKSKDKMFLKNFKKPRFGSEHTFSVVKSRSKRYSKRFVNSLFNFKEGGKEFSNPIDCLSVNSRSALWNSSLGSKASGNSSLETNEFRIYQRYWITNKKLRELLGNLSLGFWVSHLDLEEVRSPLDNTCSSLDSQQRVKKEVQIKDYYINSQLIVQLSSELELTLRKEFNYIIKSKLSGKKVKNGVAVNLVRHGNKFLFISQSRRQLVRMKEQVELFFYERRVKIHKKNIYPQKISDGFDFLGWTFINHKSKVICKISKDSISQHSEDIKQLIKKVNNPERLIIQLNSKIRAWENYHRCCNGTRKVWTYLNRYMYHLMLKWGRRRHSNKTKKWIYSKYWKNTTYGKTVCYVNAENINIILKPHNATKKFI